MGRIITLQGGRAEDPLLAMLEKSALKPIFSFEVKLVDGTKFRCCQLQLSFIPNLHGELV